MDEQVVVTQPGVCGDPGFALWDHATGRVASAKNPLVWRAPLPPLAIAMADPQAGAVSPAGSSPADPSSAGTSPAAPLLSPIPRWT